MKLYFCASLVHEIQHIVHLCFPWRVYFEINILYLFLLSLFKQYLDGRVGSNNNDKYKLYDKNIRIPHIISTMQNPDGNNSGNDNITLINNLLLLTQGCEICIPINNKIIIICFFWKNKLQIL